MEETFRIEKDSMGELCVPAHAQYGAQTQRAIENSDISGLPMPATFGPRVSALLAVVTDVPFVSNPDFFEGIATQDAAVEMSGQLKTLAVSLM